MVSENAAAEAQRRRAHALERDGRHDEAVAAYREALRLDPGHVATRVRLGVALRSAGHDEEAKHVFQSALALRTETG